MLKSWDRPSIKIDKTRSERVLDILGYSAYFGSILFLIAIWKWIPSEIPAHFNAFGKVDRWGSKWELLLLPGVGLLIIPIFQIAEKYPEVHAYPKRFNEENAEQFYIASRKFCNQIKNMISITFSIIVGNSVFIALKWSEGLGILLPLMIAMAFGIPILLVTIRFIKIK